MSQARIIEQETALELESGDYVLVDNLERGTRKYDLSALKSDFTANLIHDIASGSIANFSDGAALPVRDLSVNIEPVQAGSGDPSPTNVRPISGWTGAKVTRTGKNLLNYSTFEVGTIDSNMGQTQAANNRVRSGFIFLTEGQYTISSLNGFDTVFDVYDLEKNFIKTESTTAWNATPHTYTILGDRYVRILFRKSDNSTITLAELTGEQLELGSTATDYEPYQGETYTTDLGGTYYGGTLDVVSGLLTVDRAIVTIDGTGIAKESSTWSTWEYVYYKTVTPTGRYINTVPNIISNQTYAVSYNGLKRANKAGVISFTGNGVYLEWTSSAETLAEEQARLSSLPMQVVYELATPQTIQLTPQQVALLVGTNNIWADAGDTTVDYYADPTLYINRKIAAAVAAMS